MNTWQGFWITNEPDYLGFLPDMVSINDPRPASQQFNDSYSHGGGWSPFKGFTLKYSDEPLQSIITYPGDGPLKEIARTFVRDEVIMLFPYSWVCIKQPDGSFEICRMD